jgi:hypoxanthine phosphoribosyltransferase
MEGFVSLLEGKIESIRDDIEQVCSDMHISVIVTVSKKGTFVFHKLYNENFIKIAENRRVIPIYIDRVINKNEDYSDLAGQNILVFDDVMKTGDTFKEIERYLTIKIKDSNNGESNKNVPNFYFYSIVYCEKNNINRTGKYFSYIKTPLTYEDYYQYCLEEVNYLQKENFDTSIDLPVFQATINDVEELKNVLSSFDKSVFQFSDLNFFVGNEEINLGLINLNNEELEKALNGFLILSICRIRYKYDEESNNYIVKFTPFALTGSIYYSNLLDLYNRMFPEYSTSKRVTKEIMNTTFVKYYRYVNFYISYYIGKTIQEILSFRNISIEYTNNGLTQYGYEFNEYVKKTLDNYEVNLIEKLNYFTYTYQTRNEHKDYSMFNKLCDYDYMNKKIYERIIESEQSYSSKKNKMIQIEDWDKFYSTNENKNNFSKIISINQESYAISNELDIDFEKELVIRGYSGGETSMILLPVYPIERTIFMVGINAYYDKTKGNIEKFKDNYELFISKFYSLLKNEKYFDTNIISSKNFQYLSHYFTQLTNEQIPEFIESKRHLLKDSTIKNDIVFIRNRVEFFLNSNDFNL